MSPTVITIDGPGGSGKSTVARKVAKKLLFVHLNSGALFRALAVLARERGVDLGDELALVDLARSTKFEFSLIEDSGENCGETVFKVNGVEFSSRILGEQVGDAASKIAILPQLRQVFLQLQRDVAGKGSLAVSGLALKGLVVEGRDSGSVVFPDASFKFYLDATVEERARRRAKESSGDEASQVFASVKADLERRDERDRNREVAPQVCPEGALVIDTTSLSIEQVVDQVVQMIAADARLSTN